MFHSDPWSQHDALVGPVVHVGTDPAGGAIAVWVLGDPEAPFQSRRWTVRGTGQPVPGGASHVGSVIQGTFVWHVFEADR